MAQPWQQGQPGFQYPMQTGIPPNFQPQPGFGGGLQSQPTGYPQQRQGFAPQQMGYQQFQPGFQQPQATGFQQSQPTGFQQPQATGFQSTGFPGGSAFQHRPAPAPPPVPPIPSRFQGQPQSQLQPSNMGSNALIPPQPSFLSSSPGPLAPQQTGFVPSGGLVPQMTGFDPRLQMMGSTFMPANISSPYTPSGLPQFAPQPQQGISLQQSIQQHNQAQRGTVAPSVPWALNKAERKQYDQIFRAWDAQGTGFISGATALQVFGQSGLPKNDMARIWALADQDDRGKLNLAEFHVAMGLIYRRLNGVEIPDKLPPELVPPSSKDLGDSVDILKHILKDGPARSTNVDEPVSRAPVRSLTGKSDIANTRKDGTIYKHNEDEISSYRPSNRHLDRGSVRTGNESPSSDLNQMRRQLENASKALERAAADSVSRTAEDETLDREMEELRDRVKYVQDELDYISHGPRSFSKDEDRRKLERDLLHLMHDRIPELERKMEERDRRKAREKDDWARQRDYTNSKESRFEDRDRYSSRNDRSRYREEEDRGYLRGTFNRDDRRPSSRNDDRYRDYDRRDRSRDRDNGRESTYRRDSPYERDRDTDRGYDRPGARSPPATTRSPPPKPPVAASNARRTPPIPAASPRPDTKSMNPQERSAFYREQAQRKIQERMVALGVVSPTPTPSVDSTVEDRLQSERKEAEEKSKLAEKEAEERERLRQERLQSAKGLAQPKEQPNLSQSPVVPSPQSTGALSSPAASSAPRGALPAPTRGALPAPTRGAALPSTSRGAAPAPPAPKRAPAPPPPLRKAAARPSAPAKAPAPPPPVAPSAPPASVDPQGDTGDEALRERMIGLKRDRDLRAARLKELEELEAEEKRAEEEYQQRRKAFLDAKSSASHSSPMQTQPLISPVLPSAPAARSVRPPPPPIAPVVRSVSPALPPPNRQLSLSPTAAAATSPPVPPPAPPAPPAPPSLTPSSGPSSAAVSPGQSKHNPFNRLMSQGGDTPSPPANQGGTNPFTRPQVPTTSTPPPVKPVYTTAVEESDDDWGKEKEDDDSSDDDIAKSRNTRDMLAQKIFGSIMPSRGESPTSPSPVAKSSTPPAAPLLSSTPAPPAAPPAPQAPAPPPPPAPVAPSINGAPSTATGRAGLFSQITSGVPKLRKTVSNDRSKAAVTGNVLGDTAPPPHIKAQPRPDSPPTLSGFAPVEPLPVQRETEAPSTGYNNRQSVDWYANMAAEGSAIPHIPSTIDEDEEFSTPMSSTSPPVPDIQISVAPDILQQEFQSKEPDALVDVDLTKEYRVRSLYPYQSDRPGDLNFGQDVLIIAHPSKLGAEWWYGTLVKGGASGFFPSTYVQELEDVKVKAIYPYTATTEEELSFEAGDEFVIIERSDPAWWKTEKDDAIFVVPATYLETLNASLASVPEIISSESKRQSQLPHDPQHGKNDISSDNNETTEDEEDTDGLTDDDDESSEWLSFDDDSDDELEQDETEEQRLTEKKDRERERQRVLEAAGLIVQRDDNAPTRKKSVRPSRPTPAAPNRELPPVPQEDAPPPETPLHLDDAFERYQNFKQVAGNRLSIASSIESSVPSNNDASNSSPGHYRSTSKEENRGGYSSLLSFLGRRTPAADSEKRPHLNGLVISGPILNTPPTPSRESSPAFGSSWSSLVDQTALDGIPPEERRRQEAIFELIVTESAYVRDLQLIVEVFCASMMSMLDQKAITVIFANIEDILLTNTVFLSSLEERQKECRLYVDDIGDIIKTHMSKMGVYMQYCVNTSAALKILQSLRNSKPELGSHLQHLRDSDPSVRGLDLASYLLTPMQRITRYPLLLRQILGQTHHQPERTRVEKAIVETEVILDAINENIRENEGRDRLKHLSLSLWVGQGRLDLTQPTRFMGPRRLLKEGPLWKTKSNRRLQAFLCSDILILTNEPATALYRMPIPLSEMQVQDGNDRHDLDFKVVLSYPRGGNVINLRASSAKDARDWLKIIERAHLKCVAALKQKSTYYL